MDGDALYQCEVTVLYTLMVHQGEDSEVIVWVSTQTDPETRDWQELTNRKGGFQEL